VTLSKPFHHHSSAVATMIDPCDLLRFDSGVEQRNRLWDEEPKGSAAS